MGRALYSHAYIITPPLIKTPSVSQYCERWGVWSRFDPDSDEFFENAEREEFITDDQADTDSLVPLEANSDSNSDTGESTDGNPMAVGFDDPALLIADAYATRGTNWEGDMERENSTASQTFLEAESVLLSPLYPADEEIPPFIPPASFRQPSPVPMADGPIEPVHYSTLDRADTISFVDVAPSTPITTRYRSLPSQDLSPSPHSPSSVTPHFYSWRVPRHSPRSPSYVRSNRDGPLTNPRARMSFARIETTPFPIRISGATN
jgi:hypothetical protein